MGDLARAYPRAAGALTFVIAVLPNTRLKLAAPVVYGRIAFVNIPVRRRSLGAPR